MKTIMIIGGGILQVHAIEKAKQMGLKTIVTDYDANAPGIAISDTPVIMSTKDIEGSVRVARELSGEMNIHGVLTVGTDASMTVAAVANALKLTGIRFEDAEAATNKLKMRGRFKEHAVPSPEFFEVWTLNDAYRATKSLGFPSVIKPSDNMGARGVMAIRSKDEIEFAFRNAKSASPSGELIIEEYMEGDELSIDALIYDNEVSFVGIADRIIKNFPYFIEMGHTLPSVQPEKILEEAREVMTSGIKALRISNGAAKGDIKITKNGLKIGELAARLSGGFMSAYTFPLATGIDSIQGAIEIALGMSPTRIKQTLNRTAAERAITAPPGFIQSIDGVEDARRIKNVHSIFLRLGEGDICPPLRSNMDKIGNIISVADTRDKAISACKKSLKMIKIQIGVPPTLTEQEILKRAKEKLRNAVSIKTIFDNKDFSGHVPGFGSAGTGASYRANIDALKRYHVVTRYIHNVKTPDTTFDFLGRELKTPVLAAPVTGMKTNLGLDLDETEYNKWILMGSKSFGSIGLVGDGASPDKYKLGINAIRNSGGWGIPVFKPREDNNEIIKRIKAAEQAGAPAVGMDIDAATLITMKMKNQDVAPKSSADLKRIIKSTALPFIVKGVMSVDDALLCREAGAYAIIVSNHGGRVMDSMAGALDVLPGIVKSVKRKMLILVDGGLRTGTDVFKCLALGADAVLVGRPICISAIGAEEQGVFFILNKLTEELNTAMLLTGSKDLKHISPGSVVCRG